ncbi:hypothetical protein DFH29DRAFT_792802 [Suillus ampliporus]|nr:hypothetical protein DFH29DRAFT_792802 [Suillus ampliporus]
MSIQLLLSFFLLPSFAYATIEPVSPGPGDVFRSGSPCPIYWDTNPTQTWNDTAIYLMSGSNLDMSIVEIVVEHLSEIDREFTWTCPNVTPNAAIYFYQFTNNKDLSGSTWTSRFTIASHSGATTPPENSKQPGGDPIPWGVGHDASSNSTIPPNPSVPPPSQSLSTRSCETLKHHQCSASLANASSSDTNSPTTPSPLRQRTVSRPTALHRVNFTRETRPASRGSRRGPTLSVHFLCALATLWLVVL